METATRAAAPPTARRRAAPAVDGPPPGERRRRAGAHRGVGPDRAARHRVPARTSRTSTPTSCRSGSPAPACSGAALADGHVPLWNPFEMSGTPFAADPQSGWLSLPTMATSWVFGCGGGLRALIVLNPILAGLGLLWFLRKEGLGRDRGDRRRALARDGDLGVHPGDQSPVRRHARVDAVRPRRARPGTSRRAGWRRLGVARARGVRVGSGRDLAPVARSRDGDRPRRRVRGRARDPRGATPARSDPAPPSGCRVGVPRLPAAREPRDPGPALRASSRARAWPTGTARLEGTVARASAATTRPCRSRRPASGPRGRSRSPRRPAGTSGRPSCSASRSRSETPRRRYLVVGLGAVAVVAYLLTNTLLVRRGVVPLARARAPVRRRLPAQPRPAAVPRVPDRPGARGDRHPVGARRASVVRGRDAMDRRRSRSSSSSSRCSRARVPVG